jgi:Protein of unknown function (DUF1439)
MFRTLQKTAIILTALGLSACAALLPERTVNVTEAQVQQKLNEKLSVPLTLLKIFDINLSNPVVKFDGASERMNATFDAGVKNALLGAPFAGKAAISGKLKFDAKTNTVMLADPKIEQLNFGDHGGKYGEIIALLAAKLGGELLKDLPLYTVKAEDLMVGTNAYVPKLMKVTNQGLQVTLAPKQ